MDFACWNCNGTISADESLAESEVNCPHCQSLMVLPQDVRAPELLERSRAVRGIAPTTSRPWTTRMVPVIAAVIVVPLAATAAWSFLFSLESKLTGRWMPLDETGVSSISRWEYDDAGRRKLVTSLPPQPWFGLSPYDEVSVVEFLKDGTVLLSATEGKSSGKYRMLGSSRLEFDFGSGGTSVISVEIGSKKIAVLDEGSGRVIGSYTKLGY